MRIQHNILAMNAYRNYTSNVSALGKNLEKLSSGYKINRAGDDAAGLAISEKMRAQITGLDAAQKNVKDGISLVKTAEGAMQEVQDMLNRMDYLATQSANGTYDNEVDRANLQKEVAALKEEINRIADSANFNGIKLLDGSLAGKGGAGSIDLGDNWTDVAAPTASGANASATTLAGGLDRVGDATPTQTAAKGKYELDLSNASWTSSAANATVAVTIAGQTTTVTASDKNLKITGADIAEQWITDNVTGGKITLGNKEFKVTHDGNGKLTFTGTDNTEFDGTQDDLTFEAAGTDIKLDASQDANRAEGGMTSDVTTGGNQAWSQAFSELERPVDATNQLAAQAKFTMANADVKDGLTIKIGDETYTFAVGKDSKFKNKEGVIDLTDYEEGATDIENVAALRLSGAANGNSAAFVEADSNSGTVYITEKVGGLDRDTWDVTGKVMKGGKDASWANSDGDSFVRFGTADPSMFKDATGSAGGLTLQIGDTADSFNQMSVIIGDMHTKGMGIDGVDIGTQEGAQKAIETIRNAINYVSGIRGDLGAVQNRLEHTGNNLAVMQENIQDAESTIRDTDVASEMMSYVKNNILVQSAQAMLAQANQVPQGVLQLLG
ncbi:MAG: flagellin [Oscillospiraceae bacterium]|nr:flagellin [Oscillospiraceae bacterium]